MTTTCRCTTLDACWWCVTTLECSFANPSCISKVSWKHSTSGIRETRVPLQKAGTTRADVLYPCVTECVRTHLHTARSKQLEHVVVVHIHTHTKGKGDWQPTALLSLEHNKQMEEVLLCVPTWDSSTGILEKQRGTRCVWHLLLCARCSGTHTDIDAWQTNSSNLKWHLVYMTTM
jgi:hypothetical protein